MRHVHRIAHRTQQLQRPTSDAVVLEVGNEQQRVRARKEHAGARQGVDRRNHSAETKHDRRGKCLLAQNDPLQEIATMVGDYAHGEVEGILENEVMRRSAVAQHQADHVPEHRRRREVHTPGCRCHYRGDRVEDRLMIEGPILRDHPLEVIRLSGDKGRQRKRQTTEARWHQAHDAAGIEPAYWATRTNGVRDAEAGKHEESYNRIQAQARDLKQGDKGLRQQGVIVLSKENLTADEQSSASMVEYHDERS